MVKEKLSDATRKLCVDCQKKPKAIHQSRCSSCLSDHKRASRLAKAPKVTLKVQKPQKIAQKIIVQPEPNANDLEELFEKVRTKHNVYHSLSISASGQTRLQIFTEKPLSFNGNSLEEVLRLAL